MTCIMIVDDDDLFVMAMEIALEKEDYEVISALSGAEALNGLKTARPDLILLEIMISNRDRWKILQEIKSNEALASIPVIILTTKKPTTDILAKKTELGFTDYVTKPFELEELHYKISQALQC